MSLPEHKSLDGLTAERFVAESGWRYARTMPEIPHQYTVRDLDSPDGRRTTAMGSDEFEWFVRLIRAEGVMKTWGRRTHPYLRVGGWEYWTMGYPVEETTIVNRQSVTPEAMAEMDEAIARTR